jgi:cytochrome c biogenesis protein CcmG/thiol:disulfide interchange protein DsbE
VPEPQDILVSAEPPSGAGSGGARRVPSQRLRRNLRLLAFAVIPSLLIAVLAVGLIRTEAPRARQGALAPSFSSLPLLGGGTLSSVDLAGAPVVINFWASWCLPCQQEAPDIESTWKQFQREGVRVLGVNYEDLPSDAQAFVQRYGVTYPSVRDVDGALAARFGVRGVPETFFIDRDYRFFAIGQGQETDVRSGTKILGATPRRELVSQIKALLAYKPSPSAPTSSP